MKQKKLVYFDSIEAAQVQITIETLEPKTEVVATNTTEVVPVSKAEPAKLIAIASPRPENTFLERKWRLTSEGDRNISDFETYKANYLLVTTSSNPNDTPVSLSYPSTLDRNLDKQDIKFQVSLKTELRNNIPVVRNLPYVTSSRIWAAYS